MDGAHGALWRGERAMIKATDFQRWAEKAATMTDAALVWSASDCNVASAAMNSIDREYGGDRAGRYCDEACVYRAELASRA